MRYVNMISQIRSARASNPAACADIAWRIANLATAPHREDPDRGPCYETVAEAMSLCASLDAATDKWRD